MSEEIITLDLIARQEHFRYLSALYRLGLHDTMRMMKDGKESYYYCSGPTSLKFL